MVILPLFLGTQPSDFCKKQFGGRLLEGLTTVATTASAAEHSLRLSEERAERTRRGDLSRPATLLDLWLAWAVCAGLGCEPSGSGPFGVEKAHCTPLVSFFEFRVSQFQRELWLPVSPWWQRGCWVEG